MPTNDAAETLTGSGDHDRPRIAISTGDPNGIGPEVVLRTLSDRRVLGLARPVVVGSADMLRTHARSLGLEEVNLVDVASGITTAELPDALRAIESVPHAVPVFDPDPAQVPEVMYGAIRRDGGRSSMQAVEAAVTLCLSGVADGMVTAPISKEAIALAGHEEPGHTEFIAHLSGGDPLMMLVSEQLRVGLVTAHIALRDIPGAVTRHAILARIVRMAASLRSDFGIDRPRIAVLGLNPHAGDGGVLGREEIDIIRPAIDDACSQGHLALGPFPADGFFASRAFLHYDATLAMYHDQGLVGFKALAFGSGINFTAGLPLVRTSPDHGTAYDIAGEGTASPASMRAALFLAIDIVRRRRTQ